MARSVRASAGCVSVVAGAQRLAAGQEQRRAGELADVAARSRAKVCASALSTTKPSLGEPDRRRITSESDIVP